LSKLASSFFAINYQKQMKPNTKYTDIFMEFISYFHINNILNVFFFGWLGEMFSSDDIFILSNLHFIDTFISIKRLIANECVRHKKTCFCFRQSCKQYIYFYANAKWLIAHDKLMD
jgi:hypothetical protein